MTTVDSRPVRRRRVGRRRRRGWSRGRRAAPHRPRPPRLPRPRHRAGRHAPSSAEDVVGPTPARLPDGIRSGRDRPSRMTIVIVSPATFAGGSPPSSGPGRAGRRPTAVLAMSDAIAIGAIRPLRDLGLSIPGDVSVVGFDDIELAQTTDPPLTTVHQPIRGKGEEAGPAARFRSSQAPASPVIGGWQRDSSSGRRQDRRPSSKGGERSHTEVQARRGPPGARPHDRPDPPSSGRPPAGSVGHPAWFLEENRQE